MLRKHFDRLYVGSIVFRENWAWRVKCLDRETGMLVAAKMPESADPRVIEEVHYEQAGYAEFQKPPLGQHVWEPQDEQRLADDVLGMTVEHPDFTCDVCGTQHNRTGGVYRRRVLCYQCYWTVHAKHKKRDWRCYMCEEDAWLLRTGKKYSR